MQELYHAGVAALDRLHRGVQGRDQPLLGGVRPRAGGGHHREHEVGDERDTRHGYDFYRDDRFDSNTYFNDEFRTERDQPPAKPANDQNQFGGNLGGPIVKDKAFFFADYEGTRITKGVTRITRVPTPTSGTASSRRRSATR